jgi:hypothetical protein
MPREHLHAPSGRCLIKLARRPKPVFSLSLRIATETDRFSATSAPSRWRVQQKLISIDLSKNREQPRYGREIAFFDSEAGQNKIARICREVPCLHFLLFNVRFYLTYIQHAVIRAQVVLSAKPTFKRVFDLVELVQAMLDSSSRRRITSC